MDIIPPVSQDNLAAGGATASSSSVVFLIIALFAAYLSWNYTKEHNIETGMAVIYTLAAFNCGSCFLAFYFCFANKSE
jgi:TRAP-type C4-dicarboxylate transport system permease small subunit